MTQVTEYLMKLGLTSSQARALEVLFNGESLTAKEISSESGVPYTKIYEALSHLESIGVVKFTLETPKVYQSLEPDQVFDILLNQQQREFEKLREVKSQVLEDNKVKWEEASPIEFDSKFMLYTTMNSIAEEIKSGIGSAKKTIHAISTTQTANLVWTHPGVVDVVYNATRRGVTSYLLYPESIGGPQGILKIATQLKSPRAVLKLVKSINSPNFIVRTLPDDEITNDLMVRDEKFGGLGFLKEGLTSQAIQFDHKLIVQFLLNYHQGLWERATPIGSSWGDKLKQLVNQK